MKLDMKKIYICCPANSYTGGPTLAHQLCSILNKNGFDAYMFYYGKKKHLKEDKIIHENYKVFNNPYVLEITDSSNNIIISTETYTKILKKYNNAIKIIWWMSVDNYFATYGGLFSKLLRKLNYTSNIQSKIRKIRKIKNIDYKSSEIRHFVQSEYARLFLQEEGIDVNRIFYLSDFLEDQILDEVYNIRDKKDIVAYNPKKGFKFTQKIILHNQDIEWVPLINMSKKDIIKTLKESKLYIDFGNHPGKDRFPREAVVLGNCLITGRKGSANNNLDIPIDSLYKFNEDNSSIEQISDKMKYVLTNYEVCLRDFDDYRHSILKEKQKFEKDAKSIFDDLVK